VRRARYATIGLWLVCAVPSLPWVRSAQATTAKEKRLLNSEDDCSNAYRAFLAQSGQPASDLHEAKQLRKGDWRYFYRGARPGEKRAEVAISHGGEIVDKSHQEAWHAFLTQPGLTAEELAERFCWLHGNMALVDAQMSSHWRDAQAAVAPAAFVPDAHGRVLRFWVVYPPNMSTPFRVTVSAQKQARPKVEIVNWTEQNGGAKPPAAEDEGELPPSL
jgi:hypothetical protein